MHGQQSHTVFELLGGYHEARKLHEALTGLRKHVHDAYALSAAGGAELSPLRSAGDPVNFDRACSGKRAAATWSASNLRLPDPCRGPLPPFEGASEFAAMQMAARAASSTLYAATREGFRRFAMQPSNVSVMVALAWHAYAATYRPHDPLAADIQEHAFQRLSSHYVNEVIPYAGRQGDCRYRMWTEATAGAAHQLLRKAYPALALQMDVAFLSSIRQQLRSWTAGGVVQPAGAAAGRLGDLAADDADLDLDPGRDSGASDEEEDEGRAGPARQPTIAWDPQGTSVVMTDAMAAHRLDAAGLRKGGRALVHTTAVGEAAAACASGWAGGGSAAQATTSGRGGARDAMVMARSRAPAAAAAGGKAPALAGGAEPQSYRSQAAACLAAAAAAEQRYRQGSQAGRAATVTARKQQVAAQQKVALQASGTRRSSAAIKAASNSISGWSTTTGLANWTPQTVLVVRPSDPPPRATAAPSSRSAGSRVSDFLGQPSNARSLHRVGGSLEMAASMMQARQGVWRDGQP